MPEETLERAHDRIQLICEKIRTETLDPAREEAERIIDEAHKEAARIREQAKRDSEKMQTELKKSLEEEKRIFSSSLEQASKQAFEVLKQRIETSLFNPALESWVVEQMGGKKETASLIDTVVHAIDKEGIKSDLAVKIAARFTPDEIAAALSKQILEQLKNGAIEVGDQKAGIKVLIKAKRMMLEVTDASLKELIASFIRKDFRRVFFA